jgi:hypothetical protein
MCLRGERRSRWFPRLADGQDRDPSLGMGVGLSAVAAVAGQAAETSPWGQQLMSSFLLSTRPCPPVRSITPPPRVGIQRCTSSTIFGTGYPDAGDHIVEWKHLRFHQALHLISFTRGVSAAVLNYLGQVYPFLPRRLLRRTPGTPMSDAAQQAM